MAYGYGKRGSGNNAYGENKGTERYATTVDKGADVEGYDYPDGQPNPAHPVNETPEKQAVVPKGIKTSDKSYSNSGSNHSPKGGAY